MKVKRVINTTNSMKREKKKICNIKKAICASIGCVLYVYPLWFVQYYIINTRTYRRTQTAIEQGSSTQHSST